MDEYIFYAIWRVDLLKIVASGEEMSHTDTARNTHTYACTNEFGAKKLARIVYRHEETQNTNSWLSKIYFDFVNLVRTGSMQNSSGCTMHTDLKAQNQALLATLQ